MNVKEIVVSRVLEMLENGVPAWICPYRMQELPKNLKGRRYNGINVPLLASTNYATNRWGTYKNFIEMGFAVNEGEKAHLVVGWFPKTSKFEDEETGEEHEKTNFMLRYFNVFNICQTSMWKGEIIEDLSILDDAIKNFLKEVQVFVEIKGGFTSVPKYNLSSHRVDIPLLEDFSDKLDEYYSALFHELVHSTIKPLNRKLDYATEELVAEIGSSMLCQNFGVLKNIENSSAYCAGWARRIKDKEVNLFTASSLAEKAVSFLLQWDKREVKNESL